MKRIIFLIITLTSFSLIIKAQGLIGSTEIAIADSMKKENIFDFCKKSDEKGGLILTYLNFMHKDGTYKINEDFQLMSAQFEIKNEKCIAEFYLYKNSLLNKFITDFNSDTTKYRAISGYEWLDTTNKLSIKITSMPEQDCFLIQYENVEK